MQLDLFIRCCGNCRHLGDPIPSGVRYCLRRLLWTWAHDVTPCDDHTRPA